MRRLRSSTEARELDTRSQSDFGLSGLALMEQAGLLLYQEILRLWQPTERHRAVFLVGSGNNGGDALVVARQAFLEKRFEVTVVSFGQPKTLEAKVQRELIEKLSICSIDAESSEAHEVLKSADLWVDGIWGVGLNPPLRPEAVAILDRLSGLQTEHPVPIVALDVPSGFSEVAFASRPRWPCRWTLSLGASQYCCYFPHNRREAGEISVVPFHFPAEVGETPPKIFQLEKQDLARFGGQIDQDVWKTRRGHLGLVAGSVGMTGAAVLAARAATAAGVGVVTGFFDESIRQEICNNRPSMMTRKLDDQTIRATDSLDSMLIGPGWGRSHERLGVLEQLLASTVSLIVDADGLRVLAQKIRQDGPVFRQNWVLTPHPNELRDLLEALNPWLSPEKASNFLEQLCEMADILGAVVVAKGSVTWIVGPGSCAGVWDGREPGLATAGSGDCLAGFIGAYASRGLPVLEASFAGVILHGIAGAQLADERGWFTAEDLCEQAGREAAKAALAKF